MNKGELVDYMVEKAEGALTKKQAELAVDLYHDAVVDTLKAGKKFNMIGMYGIEPVGRNARKGHNPQTGEEIEIAAKVGVKSKPGKRLEEAVSGLDVNQFLKK